MKRLRELRIQKNLNQLDMANFLGCTTATYNRYEVGSREPDIQTIIKLADFFSVSTDYLLGRTDKPLDQKFGDKSVEIAARPLPIEMTEPQPEPAQAQKKLTGAETHEELEALVRRMVAEALRNQQT